MTETFETIFDLAYIATGLIIGLSFLVLPYAYIVGCGQ